MPWFPRVSRFGTTHMVFGQESEASCGFACAAMINYIVKKDYAAAGQVLSSALSYMPVVGSRMANFVKDATTAQICEADARRAYDQIGLPAPGPNGTRPADLCKLLNHMGMGVWRDWEVDGGVLGQRIMTQRTRTPPWPMMIGIEWDDGARHWVVCDRCVMAPDSGGDFEDVPWAVISDPWDGDVWPMNVKAGVWPDYLPGPSANPWFRSTFVYAGKRVGWPDGRMIRREG